MSAGQYRKRPVVVEAIRYGGNNGWQIRAWSGSAVIESPVLEPTPDNETGCYLQIFTLEGIMTAKVGDWIIRGIKGEFYPCKPDIFEATYEPASAPPPPATDPHEPKEPRPAPTREEFGNLVTSHGEACKRYGFSTYRTSGRKFLPQVGETSSALVDAYARLAAERDEWKRRAEEEGGLARKAESLAARKLVDYAALDIEMDEIAVALGYAEEHEGHVMRAPQATLLRVITENARARGEAEDERDEQRGRADKAEAERDAALKRCDKLEAYVRLDSLPPDPRIEAWRALDGAEREITAVMLRGFGFGTRSSWPTEAGCEIAAAALEALGEQP